MTKRRVLGINASSKLASVSKSQKRTATNGNKIRRMLAAAAISAVNATATATAMDHQQSAPTTNSNNQNGSGSEKESPDCEKFFSSGRTGRRNALPDILGDHARVTSSDLPARLQQLTTTETNKLNLPEDQPGPSRHPEQ